MLELYARLLQVKQDSLQNSNKHTPVQEVVPLVQTLVPVTVQIAPLVPVVKTVRRELELTDLIEVKPAIKPKLVLPIHIQAEDEKLDENYKLAQSMFTMDEDRLTPSQAKKIDLNVKQSEEVPESPTAPLPEAVATEVVPPPPILTSHENTQDPPVVSQTGPQLTELLSDNKRLVQAIEKMKKRMHAFQEALSTTQATLDENIKTLARTTEERDQAVKKVTEVGLENQATHETLRKERIIREDLESKIADLHNKLEDALQPRMSLPKSVKMLPGRDMTPILLDELARTEGELDRLKSAHIDLKAQTQSKDGLISDLGQQLQKTNTLAEQLIALRTEHANKVAELERVKSEAVSAEKYRDLETELRRLEGRLRMKSDEVMGLQTTCRKMEGEIRERDTTINELTNNLQNLQGKKQEMLYELLESGDKATRQDKEIQFERARWKEENRNLEFEIEKLRVELKTLLAQTIEHESDQARLAEIERQLQFVQNQKSSLTEDLSAKTAQLSAAQNQISELKIQISKLNYIKDSHQALLSRASELESKLIDTETARSTLKHEVAYLKQKEDINQILRDSLVQKVKNSDESATKKISENENLRKQLTEKEAEILSLRNDLLVAGNKYEEFVRNFSKDAYQKEDEANKAPSEGLRTLKNSAVDGGEDLKSEIQLQKLRNSQMILETQRLKDSIENLQSVLSQKEDAVKNSESQIAEMRRENTLLAKKLLERSTELKELKLKESKAQQDAKSIAELQVEMENLKQLITQQNSEISVLRQKADEASKLQSLLAEKEGTISNLRMSIAHQQSKMSSLEMALKKSPSDSPAQVASPQIDPQMRALQAKLKAAQDRIAEQEAELTNALRRESTFKEAVEDETQRLKGEISRMKTISESSLGYSGNSGTKELAEKLSELTDKYDIAQAKLNMMDALADENNQLKARLAAFEDANEKGLKISLSKHSA